MLALEPNALILSSDERFWWYLDVHVVMDRVNELVNNADLINQGALGLCGEATFYHHIFQRAPDRVFPMAETLLHKGFVVLGKQEIRPRLTLLKADYPAITAAYVPKPTHYTPMPPQADWMLLTALRDTYNVLSHHYEGRQDQSAAEGSTLQQKFEWHKNSELYSDGVFPIPELGGSVTKAVIFRDLKKKPNNHISMDVDLAMIRGGQTGCHTISLESVLTFKNASGDQITTEDYDELPNNFVYSTVSFKYWSWGDQPRPNNYWLTDAHDPTVVLTFDDFVKYFDGAIVAPYP
jgi:hypothetical protein